MFCPECGENIKDGAKFCVKCGTRLGSSAQPVTVSETPTAKPSPGRKKEVILDNRYHILGVIEKGGMGAVYKAMDTRLDNICAVKEMKENFEKEEYRIYAIEKFKSEAQILNKLRHPNIPRVFDYFIENNRYYIIMDFVEGVNLHKLLYQKPSKRCDEKELIGWSLQICDVLSYLHHLDPPIIYRDLKPANIMVTKEGRIMLVDFGIARIFNPKSKGTMIGTQGYAPPEQYRGKVDTRSDIYALGATLHHLITGKDPQQDAPFSFPPIKKLRSDVSDSIASIIEKCLKFNVEERFASVDELKQALEEKAVIPSAPSKSSPVVKTTTPKAIPVSPASLPKEKAKPEPPKPRSSGSLTSELEKLLFAIEKPDITENKSKVKTQDKGSRGFPAQKESPPANIEPTVPSFPPKVRESVFSRTETASVVSPRPVELPVPKIVPPPEPEPPAIELGDGMVKKSDEIFEKLGSRKPPEIPTPRHTIPFGPMEIIIPKKITPKPTPTPFTKKGSEPEPPLGVPTPPPSGINIAPIAGDSGILMEREARLQSQSTRELKFSEWAMFRGTQRHTGRNPSSDACTGKLKWRFRSNGRIYSCPVIDSRGNVYFGSNDGCLYSLSPEGKENWRYITDNAIYATPLVVDDQGIYFGSEDSNFYAVDFNGKELWRNQLGNAVFSSAVASREGNIYVGCNDGNLYAFRKDGVERWRYTVDNFIYSSPALSPDGTIYIGAWDQYLYAVDPSGRLNWKYKTSGIVDSSPAVGMDGALYFGSYDNFLHCLEPDGRVRWKFKTADKIYSSPALDGDSNVYFGSYDNYIYCLHPDGSVKWRFRTNYWVKSSPSLDGQGNIYVGSDDFSVYALTPGGGLRWKFKTNGSVESSPCIDDRGVLYFGSNDGWLYAVI